MDDEKEERDPRNKHRIRTSLLKKHFNKKHGFIVRDVLNYNPGSDIEEMNAELLDYWDDGLFTLNYEPLNKCPVSMVYSLNKHKRWEIPEAVIQAIYIVKKEEFRVVLLEREVPISKMALPLRIQNWPDCVTYADSKGKVTTKIKSQMATTFSDMRRRVIGISHSKKKRISWNHNVKHRRGLQRNGQFSRQRPPREDTQSQEGNIKDFSLWNGLDNDPECLEIRYEVGYPDSIRKHLKLPRNQGYYAIEQKVPNYCYKYNKGRKKALKKSKSRRSKYTSMRFLEGDYHDYIRNALEDYDEDTRQEEEIQSVCTCTINGGHKNYMCCCTCLWQEGDGCVCFGDNIYNDDDICNCHTNHQQHEKNASIIVNLSELIQRQNKKLPGKKNQNNAPLNNTSIDITRPKSVSKGSRKKRTIVEEKSSVLPELVAPYKHLTYPLRARWKKTSWTTKRRFNFSIRYDVLGNIQL